MLSAQTKSGAPLRTWDDGFGPLWLYLESCGPWIVPVGVVRAQTWEDAFSCVVDEIQADADPDDPDSYARSYDPDADPEELAEGVSWRGSGVPSNEGLESPMAQGDPGNERLVRVTRAELERHGVRVTFRPYDD
tara:strand:+ start:435 stop:836 length:402 start_codon:yes stop_codon:yes gene_type:complete